MDTTKIVNTNDVRSVDIEPAIPRLSPLERVLEQVAQVHMPSWIVSIVLALLITAGSGMLALQISRAYYEVASYHYDSAAYRVQAIRMHEQFETYGGVYALKQSLQQKDSLDITLRLVLAPELLRMRYGHLGILLPFMALFITLIAFYAFQRTRSWPLTLGMLAFLFSFPLIYDTYWGIAEYWKDNFSTWLLGAATVAWLLSQQLTKSRWAMLSGLLLGLLIMQRSVAAVYAALIFAPLFVLAAYRHLRDQGLRLALKRLGAFVVLPLLIGILLIVLQLNTLYSYYFVGGYAYSTPLQIAQFLAQGIFIGIGSPFFQNIAFGTGIGPFVVLPICLICALGISEWPRQRTDALTAGWLVVSLPLVVAMSSAYYHGFFVLWPALLIVLLATLLPHPKLVIYAQTLGFLMLFVALVAAVGQYSISMRNGVRQAAVSAPYRTTLDALAQAIVADPAAHTYAMLFNEANAPFLNQVFFGQQAQLGDPAIFITFHDNYFLNTFPNMTVDQIVAANMQRVEQHEGALVVGHCQPEQVYQPPSDPLASAVILGMNRYVLMNSHWKVTRRIDSPFGCLYIYRYSQQPLSPVAKWQELINISAGNGGPVTSVPLALAVGPDVVLLDYTSHYQPEEWSGVYYQWIPSGDHGLQLQLFTNQARGVVLHAQAIPGPARNDDQRTIVVTNGDQQTSTTVKGAQSIALPIALEPGINNVKLRIQETANVTPAPGADQRELMLLLQSPWLTFQQP